MSDERTPATGTLQVDADIRRRIEAYARAAGVTPSEVVRSAFEEYEAARNGTRPEGETVFDLLSRAGLIGCVRTAPGTPTDLGTDPKHMEGFGHE
jgi:hypothetical protein